MSAAAGISVGDGVLADGAGDMAVDDTVAIAHLYQNGLAGVEIQRVVVDDDGGACVLQREEGQEVDGEQPGGGVAGVGLGPHRHHQVAHGADGDGGVLVEGSADGRAAAAFKYGPFQSCRWCGHRERHLLFAVVDAQAGEFERVAQLHLVFHCRGAAGGGAADD